MNKRNQPATVSLPAGGTAYTVDLATGDGPARMEAIEATHTFAAFAVSVVYLGSEGRA